MARRDLDLIRNVDEALRGDAFDLVSYAGRVLEMLRRPLDPNGAPVAGMPTLGEMVDRTLADAVRQSDALLLAMAPLLDGAGAADSALAGRIRAEAAGRWRSLPQWLATHARAAVPGARGDGSPTITGVAAFGHVLGADATIIVGAELADGTPATATVFIDRDAGAVVGDAFIAPETFEAALAAGAKGVDADEFPRQEISPADARVRIERAVAEDLAVDPPLVTETWPACRPMLAWILRALPEGGTGFARTEEDPATDDALVADVARRSAGGDSHVRALIALNRAHSGSGDPRLWSDTFVEDLLLDLLPFDDAAAADPDGALAALRALVEAGHDAAGVAERLTRHTLDAIDELARDFLDLATAEEAESPDDDPVAHELALLALRVGGRRRLDALDRLPITRVVPDLRGVDDRSRAGLETVHGLIERAAGAVFDDAELAIAAARVADLLAEAAPRVFVAGKPQLAAAAVCWIAGRANDALGVDDADREVALMRALGLRGRSPQTRAEAYLGLLGVPDPAEWAADPALDDPSLLTAAARARIIARRDELRERLARP
ncbi:hypothetical protein [Microbacterium marinilacus]|uniref:Uncharacterized protein n=1 Tax=Microbacterium marinilacus TaxID=415209 RepID=A0ABP7BVF5_9MICO|nr:hypothetical protein [Microbacterium marinilacus]MBY0688278.1 hypothetical protein [Microbacterium marinilacus]